MNSTLKKALIGLMVMMVALATPVMGASLVADFTATPDDPYVGEQVDFDASTSTGTTTNSTYEWDFDGDGTYDATGVTANHSFSTAGDHAVKLLVTTEDGTTDTYTQTLTVHAKDSFDVTVALNTQGNASEMNVVVDGASQSHDIIANGDYTTSLEEGTVVEVVYINSTGDAVAKSNVSVGDGNATAVAVDDASFDYTETVAATGGSGSSDDEGGFFDTLREHLVLEVIILIIVGVLFGRGRGGK